MLYSEHNMPPDEAVAKRSGSNNITAYLLRTLSQGLVDALNAIPDRTAYAFLEKHMASQFCMQNSGGHEFVLPHVQTRREQVDNVLALRRIHPEWKLHIYHVSAVVDSGADEGFVELATAGGSEEYTPTRGRACLTRSEGGNVVAAAKSGLKPWLVRHSI